MKNKFKTGVSIALVFLSISVFAPIVALSFETGAIDTVFFFAPGEGQNKGQEPEYYPNNIFGPPDTNAKESVPAAAPEQILSIGLDGEIVVGFKDLIVIDGEGPDFTIFENAFKNPVTGKIFAEPAKVAVSPDGETFFEFPYDFQTLEGCAGVTPTYGKENPFDPEVSGGDKFDLADIGFHSISAIKITDICRGVLEDAEHPFHDPIITGFDLDAVVGLHLEKRSPMSAKETKTQRPMVYQTAGVVFVRADFGLISMIEVYNYSGNRLEILSELSNFYRFELTRGFYMFKIEWNEEIYFEKVAVF